MAKPRIFVSSTYYDLKHLRSSLDNFIESLGFEPILSEKGNIAFTPDIPLDESCYREVQNADVFVFIIGGRYGSETSSRGRKLDHKFFEKYDSITKKEYDAAVTSDIPTFVLIETGVYSEYETFLRNKNSKSIKYAHVDSVNIFRLIQDILAKPRNNPFHTFERFSDIESWLREQWAGLFRELLHRMSNQQQIATLSSQIAVLQEVNTTLKRYLEAVMTKIPLDKSKELIQSEQRRLEEKQQFEELREELRKNRWVRFIMDRCGLDIETIKHSLEKARSFRDFCANIAKLSGQKDLEPYLSGALVENDWARREFNEARQILGLRTFRLR